MSGLDEGTVRKRFLVHALIAIVTLGLYMPVWLASRDAEIRERVSASGSVAAAWLLGAGIALGLIARGFLGDASPTTAFGVSLVAAGVFLGGVYLVAHHLQAALDALGVGDPISPLIVTAGLGLVFVGIELGNQWETWYLRGPVFVLIATLPYWFWRLHTGFETVRAQTEADASTS